MHSPNVRLRMTTVAIMLCSLSFTACSKRREYDVFDLRCGPARLVLHEDYLTTFETSYVAFELRYIEGKKVRLVDKLKPRARLYVKPTPAQHLHRFRHEAGDDPWPIFVSPTRFSLAEYEQIRETLESSLAVIDEAVNRPREPVKYFREDRKPMISSIRYVDYDGLRHIYSGPDKQTDLTVEPDGSVWLRQAWGVGGATSASIGLANGQRVLLAPYGSRLAQSSAGRNIYTLANLQQWKSRSGQTIFNDFVVSVSPSETEFEAAMSEQRRTNVFR